MRKTPLRPGEPRAWALSHTERPPGGHTTLKVIFWALTLSWGSHRSGGGCRRSPLAGSGKTGVHRQLRLTGSQGGGQQAVGSCAASVVWERSPRSSSQRFSVVGSVRERVGESELRVRWSRHQAPLPGWELALAPSLPPSGYKIARNRLWLLGVQRQKEEIDIMQVLGSVNGVPLAPLPC